MKVQPLLLSHQHPLQTVWTNIIKQRLLLEQPSSITTLEDTDKIGFKRTQSFFLLLKVLEKKSTKLVTLSSEIMSSVKISIFYKNLSILSLFPFFFTTFLENVLLHVTVLTVAAFLLFLLAELSVVVCGKFLNRNKFKIRHKQRLCKIQVCFLENINNVLTKLLLS